MLFYGPIGWDYAPYLDIEGIHVMPGLSAYADVAIRGISKSTAIDFILKCHAVIWFFEKR